MISDEYVQREILRLAGNNHKSACISTRRISAFYNMPESRIRWQLTTLAEQKKIRLTGWDGRALRPYSEWGECGRLRELARGWQSFSGRTSGLRGAAWRVPRIEIVLQLGCHG